MAVYCCSQYGLSTHCDGQVDRRGGIIALIWHRTVCSQLKSRLLLGNVGILQTTMNAKYKIQKKNLGEICSAFALRGRVTPAAQFQSAARSSSCCLPCGRGNGWSSTAEPPPRAQTNSKSPSCALATYSFLVSRLHPSHVGVLYNCQDAAAVALLAPDYGGAPTQTDCVDLNPLRTNPH